MTDFDKIIETRYLEEQDPQSVELRPSATLLIYQNEDFCAIS